MVRAADLAKAGFGEIGGGTSAAQRRGMTAPRPIVPGAVYLITRRCAQRQFLLRPSQLTNEVFQYVLAVAARRHRIRVHGFCVMSNHAHLLVTDPEARLPDFQRDLGALVARAMNAALGRWESFWSPESYSAVRLVSPEDVVRKAAYALANPAAAGLVRTGRLWPGLWSDPERIGAGPVELRRPQHFFSEKGGLPEVASLELTAPAGFVSPAEFRAQVLSAVAKRERRAEQKFGRNGFLGVARVLKQSPFSRPSTTEPRRKLSPRVAARNTWKRIEALARDKAFLQAYRSAWAARRDGETDVVFPAGTYLLRVAHGVRCAGFS
jgi:REP element-mobilizing transposase RayT